MAVEHHPAATDSAGSKPRGPSGRKTLLLLIAVCVAPVVASYLAYYFMPPEGRVNYGELIDPQQTVVELWTTPLADTLPAGETERLELDTPLAPEVGAPASPAADAAPTPGVSLEGWRGRWLLVLIAPGACDAVCQNNLYNMRQVRLTTGRDRDRVQRLWLVTDSVMPDADLLAEHAGLVAARVDPAAAAAMFSAAPGLQLSDHIFVVDPLGNSMMRFPAEPNPSRMKKDIQRLLKASRIG